MPMCPLDSANSDSDWARDAWSSPTSRTDHGSTGNRSSVLIGSSSQQFFEIADDDVGPVRVQRLAVLVVEPVDADDEAEVAAAPGLDPGGGVLEHDRAARVDPGPFGTGQEGVGRRLPGHAGALDRDPVHPVLDIGI